MSNHNQKLAKAVNSEIVRLAGHSEQLQQSADTIHETLKQYQDKANQLLNEKYDAISQLQIKLDKLQCYQHHLLTKTQADRAPITTPHEGESTLDTALTRAGSLIDLSQFMSPVSEL